MYGPTCYIENLRKEDRLTLFVHTNNLNGLIRRTELGKGVGLIKDVTMVLERTSCIVYYGEGISLVDLCKSLRDII